MVRSMTAAVSGLRSHQTRLDVIGNNIANVNTYGYKSARVVFRDSMYQTTSGATGTNNQYAGVNSNQVGYGTKVGSISNMWTTGSYYPTDYGTDVMINGRGYFIVGDASASGTSLADKSLTRVGEFDVVDGYLVDANGNYVYGVDPANPNTLVRIQMPNNGANPPVYDKISNISIGDDGKVSYTDANNVNRTLTVQVAVAYVENPNGLEADSSSYFKIGVNSGETGFYIPGNGATGKLMAGGLEMSTVDLSKEMTDMITTQRGYQANSRIITVTDEMLAELVNLKR